MQTLQAVPQVFTTTPMPKRNNKYPYLLAGSLHKATRFVQFVGIERVFYHTKTHQQGSSALIVIYTHGLTTFMMQKIAKKTDQPATVFLNKADISKPKCAIRWFNPNKEILRCGHGTLATAYFLKKYQRYCPAVFRRGKGIVSNEEFKIISQNGVLQLQLAPIISNTINNIEILSKAVPVTFKRLYQTSGHEGYTTALIDSEVSLKNLKINVDQLKLHPFALIILQKTKNKRHQTQWRFRYFAPYFGVNEDNATGSALSIIAPIIKSLSAQTHAVLIQESPSGAVINYQLKNNVINIS